MLWLTIKYVLRPIINKLCPRSHRLLLVFIKHGPYLVERLRLGSVIVVSWYCSVTPTFNDLLSTLILTNFVFKYGV